MALRKENAINFINFLNIKPLSMRSLFLFYILVSITVSSFAQVQPPVIEKKPKVFNEHGIQRTDDYYWLSDPTDTNVLNILHAENRYVEASLQHTAALQKKIYDEMVERIPGKDQSLPWKTNGYWYYTRFEEGKQYPYYARKKGTTKAPEQVFLNVPEMAANYKIFLVRGWEISPDNNWLAYSIDTSGDRRSRLFFKNLNKNIQSDEVIPNTTGSVAWAKDNKTVFYIVNDHTVRGYKLMRHTVGTDPAIDKNIYTETDSTYRIGLYTSKNGKYIFLHSGSTMTTEVRYIDAANPAAAPVLIQERIPGLEYSVSYYEGDVFHIRTNKDAVNYKFVTAPIRSPQVKNWKDLIPHNPEAYLQSLQVLKNYYVVQTKEKGLSQIKIYDRKAKKWKSVNFGQDAYVANMSMATDDYATDSIRYSFTSLVTPASAYQYNLRTGSRQLLKQQKVGEKFDADNYITKRIWVTAKDGKSIPVSIVYRNEKFRKDGSNPLYLYAYGSYGANSDPYFNSSVISLLDRGVVYAIAHIRGGQELGREWYNDGKVLTKKNTFTDFIDAAQYLVDKNYTKPDRLFANGASAGGMLMGVVANSRPDLFRGIIAEVPWMDVITDMFNTDLPLTTLEYDEWGDPNRKDHYDYMMTWSPLDNVSRQAYPALFATGGLHDTQVPYFSPAKWVAKVREYTTGFEPVYFKVNMGAGHGGESGRYERQKLEALKYSFILDQLGWNEETKTYHIKPRRTF
jgi:oligopeptidase B